MIITGKIELYSRYLSSVLKNTWRKKSSRGF